jgi:hypothetical protein
MKHKWIIPLTVGSVTTQAQIKNFESLIIDRCAQVADEYANEYLGHPTVGAAIRALKDEP